MIYMLLRVYVIMCASAVFVIFADCLAISGGKIFEKCLKNIC